MVYEEVQLAGIPSKLNEVSLLNQDPNSSIHKDGSISLVPMGLRTIGPSIEKNSEKNPEQQPWKACN